MHHCVGFHDYNLLVKKRYDQFICSFDFKDVNFYDLVDTSLICRDIQKRTCRSVMVRLKRIAIPILLAKRNAHSKVFFQSIMIAMKEQQYCIDHR
jgi:hypothetical protein